MRTFPPIPIPRRAPGILGTLTALALPFLSLQAQLNVPSDGSDGALVITQDTVIDLSLARSGVWSDNNAGHAGHGVYDPGKWAVVFKYTSVHIEGRTVQPGGLVGHKVRFSNHPSHAPVVWLVQGDVTIDGIVDLSGLPGGSGTDALTPSEPGPGGFRGGAFGPSGSGGGFGPGGDASWRTRLSPYRTFYGNPQILPLIGGSGTSGETRGNSGGGAILIVAGGTVTVNGQLLSKSAGLGYYSQALGNASSGGAIKIMAHQVLGEGVIDAELEGRTRVEANVFSSRLNITPNTVAVPPGVTPAIWPPDNAPTVRVASVDGQPAPADPLAPLGTSSDIGMQNNAPVDILLETRNFPIQGVVSLRIGPKFAGHTWVNATYVSGDIQQAVWKVTTTMPAGFAVLQARATAP